MNGLKKLGLLRGGGVLLVSFLVLTAAARSVLLYFEPSHPIRVHVRWTSDVDDLRRAQLEQQLSLTLPEFREGTTWLYFIPVPSTDAIRAIVQHPNIEDTQHVDRVRFRPSFNEDAPRRALYYGAVAGGFGSLLVLFWIARWLS